MKAKMFVYPTVQEAEKAVNEWLQNNDVNVQYIGQSQSEQSGRFVFIISVFYHTNREEAAASFTK